MKKMISPLLLGLTMLACSDLELFYSQKHDFGSYERGNNCLDFSFNAPQGTSIRKQFIPKQFLAASPQRRKIQFEVKSVNDTKRQFLLNVRKKGKDLEGVVAKINGQTVPTFLPGSKILNQETPDMVANLCRFIKLGENTIELEINGSSESEIEVFLDGFMLPINIENAFHSFASLSINDDTLRGVLYIKFLEGMRIRLKENNQLPFQLVDLSGISLYPLQQFIQQYDIEKVEQTFPGTPAEHDQLEKKREEAGIESTNRNLMYTLRFDESVDTFKMLRMANTLQGMPFVEVVTGENLPIPANN